MKNAGERRPFGPRTSVLVVILVASGRVAKLFAYQGSFAKLKHASEVVILVRRLKGCICNKHGHAE
jgi:hypothetical protein